MSNNSQPFSFYIHIPFCASKCSYCDFNAYAGMDELIAPYAEALATEIRTAGNFGAAGIVHTIFFGGGTPSLTPLDSMAVIFSALKDSFRLTSDCEITLEANPGTVNPAYLEALRQLGVNRLSFGVQSAQPNELALFNRIHSFDDAAEAVAMARRAGFENVNVDLIYGIPGQSLEGWRETVSKTLALGPDHLSLYALSLEFGTPMRAWVRRGLLAEPDDDRAAEMYEWADEQLEAAGFAQYEISNWAKAEAVSISRESNPDRACRHNLQYWRHGPYLGFGAGAHGCAGGFRYSNVRSPAAYIRRMRSGAASEFPFSSALAHRIPLDEKAAMDETMMLGLRLVREGVRKDDFWRRFGARLDEVYEKELRELTAQGLIKGDGDAVRLTRRARLLGNLVFEKFVP